MKILNKQLIVSIFIILSLFLYSCGGVKPPTPEQLSTADYGNPISQQNAENIAREFFNKYLKDPASAQYKWNKIETGWIQEARIDGGELKFGYILVGYVNAKNSFGGYTGAKFYQLLFRNGQLISALGEKTNNYGSGYMTKIY